ncbi:MAG: hypothetical protein GEU75_16395 [Dehalococcoidia bacterium]|nr:hypothetical protein [Dehalococcoidia bacterium]
MSYEARKREVLEELAKQGYEPQKAAEYSKLIENYFAERDAWLESVLASLVLSEEATHGQWLDRCKRAAASAQDLLTKGQESIWLAKLSNEEHTFFFELMVSQVPVQRDLMVQKTKALTNAEKEFEAKWNTIRDADRTLDDRIKEIAQEYEKILMDAASAAAKAEKESSELLAEKIKVGGSAISAIGLGIIGIVVSGIGHLLSVTSTAAATRKSEVQALLSRKMVVIAAFTESRDMVKEFLKETSYPRIKEAYEAAEDAAEALAGQMPTEGQEDDAGSYGGAIKNELTKVFAKAEGAYKDFARKHEYLFFGPLGGSYYQELSEQDFWKQHSENWQRSKYDIDSVLRDQFLDVTDSKILGVSMDGLNDEDRKAIRTTLEEQLRELLSSWNKFKEENETPYSALESREKVQEALDSLKSS